MIHGIHRCDYGEKNLGGANVTRGLVTADVLFARLHREPIPRPAGCVVRDADEAARHVALVSVAGREIGGMRPAESERDAEPLGAANGDVSPEFSGRFEQSEGEKVPSHNQEGADIVGGLGESLVIVDSAVRRRVLNERAEHGLVEFESRKISDDHFEAERLRASLYDLNRLRMAIVRDEKCAPGCPHGGAAERHRLRRGRALVEQRGVGDV